MFPLLSRRIQDTFQESLFLMQFSSSLCPFWGCMMLLLRNLTTTASLCPWAPVQPVGRIQPCPLRCCSGRAPGAFGQGSSPQVWCVAGRQPGCEGECGGRASASSMLGCCAGVPGDSVLRAPGSWDGCCSSEQPFSCLLGAAAISQLLCQVIPP